MAHITMESMPPSTNALNIALDIETGEKTQIEDVDGVGMALYAYPDDTGMMFVAVTQPFPVSRLFSIGIKNKQGKTYIRGWTRAI